MIFTEFPIYDVCLIESRSRAMHFDLYVLFNHFDTLNAINVRISQMKQVVLGALCIPVHSARC